MKNLVYFDEVAKVLGKELALKEIQKVKDSNPAYFQNTHLSLAFPWGESPQGWAFWHYIDSYYIPTTSLAQCHPLDNFNRVSHLIQSCGRNLGEISKALGQNPVYVTRILTSAGYLILGGIIAKKPSSLILLQNIIYSDGKIFYPTLGVFDDYDQLGEAVHSYDHSHGPTLYRGSFPLNKLVY